MISSFIFSNNVSAQDSVIWTGRGDGVIQGTFTSEHLNKIIEYNSLDTSVYDSFIIYDNSGYWNNYYYKNQFGIYFYNSDDYKNGRVSFTQNGNNSTVYYSGSGKGIYHLEIYNSDRTDFYDMMNFDWYNYEQSLTYIDTSYQNFRSVNIYEHFPARGLISDYPIPIIIVGKGGHIYKNLTSEKVVIYNTDANSDYSKINNFRYVVIPETVKYLYKHSAQWWIQGTSTFGDNQTELYFSRYEALSLDKWSSMVPIENLGGGLYTTSFQDFVDYSYYDIWNNNFTEILYCGDVETECSTASSKLNVFVDTDEVRSIKLDFIIPSNSLGTSLDFSYNINSNNKSFDSPYFTSLETYCSTDETGASSCTPFPKTVDWVLDYNIVTSKFDMFKKSNTTNERFNKYEVNNYSYTLFDDSKSVQSISMFISFDTVNGFDVNVNFESNLDFTVTYNYKNTSDVINDPFLEDYYSTIDLTGKYGVAFLPQTNLDDSYTGYRTLFKADNMVDIQLRDNYDSKEYIILSAYSLNYCNEFLSNQNVIPYSCNNINGVFDFYINQDIDNQTLFFINKNYENNSSLIITYDTRYYSYVIFDSEYSTGTVVRPGEDEETEIFIGYFYNYYDKYKNYELEHSFEIFLKPIKFIFNSISDFYNYYCPPVFRHFLIISFTFVVSLILIRLFL